MVNFENFEGAVLNPLSLGEPLIEFNQRCEGGRTLYLPGLGGDTSNVAVAAACQGARVGYLTRIGQDAFGDLLLDLWHVEGIDTAHVIRDAVVPTGIYFNWRRDYATGCSFCTGAVAWLKGYPPRS